MVRGRRCGFESTVAVGGETLKIAVVHCELDNTAEMEENFDIFDSLYATCTVKYIYFWNQREGTYRVQ